MKKKNFKIALSLIIFFYNVQSFSQVTTTTILYDATSGLSTTACNVFDPPVSIGGKLHTGVIGGATYSDANGLKLPTQYTYATDKTLRTDYKISYSFKSGYTYSIEITAFGDISTGSSYPTIGGGFFTTQGLTNTSTSCTVGDIAGFPQQGAFLIAVSNTANVYAPINNVVGAANYDYLLLEAYMNSTTQNVSANVYIKKIIIKETPPVSFTLPVTTSIPCGSTTAQTFTVTNVKGTTGITNYNWNLGAIPNNWLYNGIAAPATVSTGTTNTITLTPVCGSTPKNVSATVSANGNTYNTNTSTVSITSPSLTINGLAAFCTPTSNYTLSSSVPCGGSVTWSSSNTSVMTVNQSTGVATKVSNGTANIIATIGTPNPCSIPVISKTIAVGAVSTGPIKLGPATSVDIEVYVDAVFGATSYNWYKNGVMVANEHNSAATIPMQCGINASIAVEAVYPCGTSPRVSRLVKIPCPALMAGDSTSRYSVSPNPTNGDITVNAKNRIENTFSATGKNTFGNNDNFKIAEIIVYNLLGTAVKKIKLNGTKQSSTDLSSFKNGSYYIEIISTNGYREKQLIILQKQ
jgi:hypothetical protein